MNISIEYPLINPELNEIENIINNTIKEYNKKYGNSHYKRLEYIYNIQFFDKKRTKQKIIKLQLDLVRI